MGRLLKCLLTFIVVMIGTFLTYKAHTLMDDWNFTVAFLGGSVTMLIALLIHKNQKNLWSEEIEIILEWKK